MSNEPPPILRRFEMDYEIKPIPIPVVTRGYSGQIAVRAETIESAMATARNKVASEHGLSPDRVEITRILIPGGQS